MNSFLEKLFDVIAIDIEYLTKYLTSDNLVYLNNTLKSIGCLNDELYTEEQGDNLEVLLCFLIHHAKDIADIWEAPSKKEILVKLYTSSVISGNYECFHFDLSKFAQTYQPKDQKITLYRIGREQECKNSLGNSWSIHAEGLKNYAQSSSIQPENRPVFVLYINDSEVLCEGNPQENELILKKGFEFIEVRELTFEKKRRIFAM